MTAGSVTARMVRFPSAQNDAMDEGAGGGPVGQDNASIGRVAQRRPWMVLTAVASLALIVAACGGGGGGNAPDPTERPTPQPTDPPWPLAYEQLVCGAVQQLLDSGTHITEMSDAAGAMDLDVLIEEANAAGQDAREAGDFLESAPDWAPGAGLKKWLGILAENTRTAANLGVLGAQTLDTATLDEATAMFVEVNQNTVQVGKEIDKLQTETDFVCP